LKFKTEGVFMKLHFIAWSIRIATGIVITCAFHVSAPAVRAQSGGKPNASTTPRMSDGHPDMNGYWESAGGGLLRSTTGKITKAYVGPPQGKAPEQSSPKTPSKPSYKPELIAKVKDLAENEAAKDPAFFCRPLGVPRIGPPLQIVQTPKIIVFFYQPDAGVGTVGGISVRIIPTDGSPHRADADPSFLGDSIGHWDGDTLVVDVNNFNEDTWLDAAGHFHSTALHVIERLHRRGNVVTYQATVEDPTVLVTPWIMDPRTLTLGSGVVEETPPCQEEDESHLQFYHH
jgi:hypothetical protein